MWGPLLQSRVPQQLGGHALSVLEQSEDQVGPANPNFQNIQQSGDPLPLSLLRFSSLSGLRFEGEAVANASFDSYADP